MKSLLTVTALLEGATGLALAAFPSLVASVLLGTSLADPAAVLIARLAGAALITIAIASWLSRNNAAAYGIVKALLFYNGVVAFMLAYCAFNENLSSVGLVPVALLHSSFAVWCFVSLIRHKKIIHHNQLNH